MSKKITVDEDLDFLNKQQRDHKASVGQNLAYGLTAIAASCVPHYIYMTMFNMTGEENYIIFGVVTIITTALLCTAYHNVWKSIVNQLFRERKGFITEQMVKGKKEDKARLVEAEEENQYGVTSSESLSFSLIYNNLFFYVIVIVLGFFLFRSVPNTYNYVLSTVVSAGLVLLSSMN